MTRLSDDFWPSAEASRQTGFSRNVLDRRSEHRTEEIVAEAFGDPEARALVFNAERRLILDPEGSPWLAPEQWRALGAAIDADSLFLGWSGETKHLAIGTAMTADDLPEPYKAIDIRSLYAQGLLSPEDEGAVGQAHSLMSWHGSHRFCGNCGGESAIAGGGVKRACAGCGRETFPRIDPVAIMLVTDGERALLGRSPHFPEGMYSCLAGFVEHGETAEDTVRREVLEESGIRVGAVRYHASQPWPMPHSLMMGFYGKALSDDIRFDRTELDDCRWFSRDEVVELLGRRPSFTRIEADEAGDHTAPPRGAIAARLMADWVRFTE